ncbi:alpha/beta hydrolase [Demequina muriae]|uniref:Alpha/beta hydrolase n=1 Tax=Demequina muriae TaxID=3051664 RepID=A0ABT8GGJ1_9MICO|nr:alpha/beta hydrolase [Demequina sp. EGI L300058]MDN4480554.1 alpha/beta hydrolase [Demequina sp. EGI L300058]
MNEEPPRPPFDPEVARALAQQQDIIVTTMSHDDIPRVRGLGADVAPTGPLTHGGFDRADLTAPGRGDMPDVPVVVLTPPGHGAPAPVLVFLHGGGMIAGIPESDLDAMADLAHHTGCAVVSVAYRLAPEQPYPAAADDVVTALEWLASGAAPAALDPRRIVLSGISAGGGLAASVALRCRDTDGPRISGLLLMCPMLDHRSNSASALQMIGAGSWDATANATAWEAYLGGAVPTSHASAALADDLSELPPVFIDVGSTETFRDECVDFASRLWQHGGDAELHVWPGGAHAFDMLAPWTRMARTARDTREAWLRRLLTRLPAA